MRNDRFDDMLRALSAPARPDELAGEADAVERMRSVLVVSDIAEPTRVHGSSSRRARVAALVAAGVVGFGGMAAAGPGTFLPAADRPSFVQTPEAPPTSHPTKPTEPTVTTPETTTPPTTEPTVTTPETSTPATLGPATSEPATATASVTELVDDPDTTFDETLCAEGNHGETVSSVAQATEPGPDHGPTVSEAAQSSCGKDAAGDVDELAAEDADDDDGDGGNGKPDHAGKPANRGKPADAGSRGRGNADDD